MKATMGNTWASGIGRGIRLPSWGLAAAALLLGSTAWAADPTIDTVAVTAATEDSTYTYNISASDTDGGDTVSISADTQGGGGLPGWLSLTSVVNGNPGTATLTGTPDDAEVTTGSF